MSEWAMIIDVALCTNCRNCWLACKDEHVDNRFPGYAEPQPLHGHDWIDIRVRERGSFPMVDVAYLPVMCQHCEDAPCRTADGAVRQREDGIVVIDPDKAKGRREIVDSCPWGAIFWNEELELPQKWDFDAHLLDAGWSTPRCVQVCPTGALRAEKLDAAERARLVAAEGLETLPPGVVAPDRGGDAHGGRPRVLYRNLHRFTRHFLGGTVLSEGSGGQLDAVEGAEVSLDLGEDAPRSATTDSFGDFRIDDIADGASYGLTIRWQGRVVHESRGRVEGGSLSLGDITVGR